MPGPRPRFERIFWDSDEERRAARPRLDAIISDVLGAVPGARLAEDNWLRRCDVAFDIEKANGVIRLSVLHDGFEPGSVVYDAIREGWPPLLSSLKTFLETGEALDFSM